MKTTACKSKPVWLGQPSLFDTHSPTVLLISLNVCGCATIRKTSAERNEISSFFSAIFRVYATKKIHLKAGNYYKVY